MKTLKCLAIALCIGLIPSVKLFCQEIQINSIFTRDTVLFPFEQVDRISSMTIEGSAHMHQDTSLVRVILEDNQGVQYMIMEAYPLICNDSVSAYVNYCDETCALDQVDPYSVIIQVINGTLNFKSLYYTADPKEKANEQRYIAKRAVDANKIEIMNERITSFGMNWVPGDNGLVAKYYEDKRQMFGDSYNLIGYEYYKVGVYEFLGHSEYQKADPNLVKEFDWRDRHGANNPLSPYWDGDPLGTGWHSPVKNQYNTDGCYVFGAVGVIEALANLSAVCHKDIDLSEQYLLACFDLKSNLGNALDTIKDVGCITEFCFPLDTNGTDCINKCQSPDSIFKIKDTINIFKSDSDSIRIALIYHGPLGFSFRPNNQPAGHAVTLSGFQFDELDSTINWIIKDSYGTDVGINGFRFLKVDNIKEVIAAVRPVFLNDTSLVDTCYDKDLDGYYFWGVGTKPLKCNCEEESEDCDDNDPYVGGYDENYYCSCLMEYNSTPEHITRDTTWNDSINLNHPLIIDSRACLTITSDVMCHPNVKITVNRGGKLVLDGGRLSNSCPGLWEGIEVLGSDTSQYYSQYFGILSILNGGTIENAKKAVSNFCKLCEDPYSYSGGIITAEDAVFRNNLVTFEFAPYRNIYQGSERPYLASFQRCQFIYDDVIQEYGYFKYFIKFNQVNGITIKGCDFVCDSLYVLSNNEKSSKYRSGIYSFGSHFYVDEACAEDILPCPRYLPCVFNGLNYGIYALGITGTEVISIKKSNFISNRTGIYLSGENYATVVQDTFKVYYENRSLDTICGLYLDYCTGYQVEENYFHGNYKYQEMQLPSKCVGIAINNSGEEYNEIYNNRFDSLYIGTLAQNVNRGSKEGAGLQILCNNYTRGYFDISVTSYDTVGISGISDNQGSDGSDWTSPANNTFSYSNPNNNNDFSDYFNECENLIYWYLKDTVPAHVKPRYYSRPEVNPQFNYLNNHEYVKDSCCPSSLNQGGGELLLKNRAQMNDFLFKADSLESLIHDFEDGGNTYELRNDILTSSQEDANILYELLSAYSPYLSDSVMIASVEKEAVFNSEMVTGVLSENPQAAKSDTVQFVLDNRIDKLSEEQRIEIDQGWFITGDLEIMKSTYAFYKRRQSNAFYTLARTFKCDTSIVNAFDSLITLYQEYPTLRSKYDLAFEYAEKEDSIRAFTALNAIPENYFLTTDESGFHQQANQFLSILSTYFINKNYNDLDSTQVDNLLSLASSGRGQIRALAGNILLANNYSNYKGPFLFPQQTSKSERIKRIPVKMDISLPSFLVFPNPANNQIQIELINVDSNSNGIVSVFDITGKLVLSRKISKWQKSLAISTEYLMQGAYLLLYTDNNGHTQSKKLIISE